MLTWKINAEYNNTQLLFPNTYNVVHFHKLLPIVTLDYMIHLKPEILKPFLYNILLLWIKIIHKQDLFISTHLLCLFYQQIVSDLQ